MKPERPGDEAATASETVDGPTDPGTNGEAGGERVLSEVALGLAYIPDFLPDQLRLWLTPNAGAATSAHHELVGEAAETWASYYSKKGFQLLQSHWEGAEGPYRVAPGGLRLEILEPGRFFAPKPFVRIASGAEIPLDSIEKRRPLNPWKPNHIRATNFIKRYEWREPVPRAVHYAVWEIEECGEIPGSTSWMNAESIIDQHMSDAVRRTLSDIFYNRLEDFPLGSQVYLRVLGRSGGADGFAELIELAEHPIARKRRFVATAFGELADPRARESLLRLLDDEDPEVRTEALRAIGRVGITRDTEGAEKIVAHLDSDEPPKRVWAAQSLLRGGETELQKFFIDLIKNEPRLLTDMGEMGDVLRDLELYETVPFIINRLKHADAHFRADAAEALEKITGLEIGYHLENQEDRRRAVRQCSRWWEDFKRERRAQKKG